MIIAHEPSLIVAVVIGFGFGFVLERAGFGRADKLAAQFYLYDMTVFKVMFSAIVTAMLGLVILSGIGLINMKEIADAATSFTFLWPMLVGGFVLGLGFIIAGYCPGTSLVSAASGNIDGMIAFAGVIAGTVAYSELFPLISKFHSSGELGNFYLYELFKLPPPVVALLVALMAIGCFFGAEKVEAIFRKKLSKENCVAPNVTATGPRRFAFAAFATAAAVGMLTLALPARVGAVSPVKIISLQELAASILQSPWSVRIMDLRPYPECAARRIPGSECTPPETLKTLALGDDNSGRDIILVGPASIDVVPAEFRHYSGRIFSLEKGFQGWTHFALTPPARPLPTAAPSLQEEFRLRSAVYSMLTGAKSAAPPPPAPAGGSSGGARKKGGGCSS